LEIMPHAYDVEGLYGTRPITGSFVPHSSAIRLVKLKLNCGICTKVCPYHAIIRVPIPCEEACPTAAISKGDDGHEQIDYTKCIFCGKCIVACPFGAIMEKSELIEILQALSGEKEVFALLAPAAAGQFKGSMEQLSGAVKQLGFTGTVEVAFGADQTSEDEAAEFTKKINAGDKFMTSTCCPAYTEAVEKQLPEIKACVSSTPTPMHYTGKYIKDKHPEAITVFIGPCVAKRHEAITDRTVDFVMTFEELGALFVAKGIDIPKCQPEDLLVSGRKNGRGYPVSQGITHAIQSLVPDETEFEPLMIDGLSSKTIKLLKAYAKGKCPGNFIEVMACEGGCVAGPGVFNTPAKATRKVNELVSQSEH